MKSLLNLRVAAAALVASSSLTLGQGMIPITGDPVPTASGKIAGTVLPSGVKAYLGIPFAQSPTGKLRWAPPQPNHWQGVWNADRKGPECMQVLRPHNINHYFGEEPTSENCLFMNVWAPASATAGAKLPVIVFIYGGGFTIGSSGMANYDGEAVAKAGAVFVNFNYRVGALGFLAHPELTKEQGGHSGNYALLDQSAALRWIHDNIESFGGDPNKILISGQSAGARSVQSQILSPLSRGLFRAAMMSSGCNFAPKTATLGEAEKVGIKLQERLGAANLAEMRDIPADRILAAQSESQVGAHVEGIRVPSPIVDGYAIPAQSEDMIRSGNFNKVPIIASYNTDDIDLGRNPIAKATTVAEFQRIARQTYGSAAGEFLKLYPVKDDAGVRAVALQAARESGFELAARQCARMNEQFGGQPGFIDQFAHKHPYVPGVKIADQNIETIGAYHTADIPYWFGTLDKYNMFRPTRNWTAWDRQLSADMMNALIKMAATGSPDTAAMPWPSWTPNREVKIVFGDSAKVEPLNVKRLDWFAAHPLELQAPTTSPSRPRD